MIGGVTQEIAAPYRPLGAWFYDRYISPAVTRSRPQIFNGILESLPSHADVLDVGCGGGQLAIGLAGERPHYRIQGVDLSPQQIARAERRNRKAGTQVGFLHASAMVLPFDRESFDLVYSIGSLKHWASATKGLSECVRTLRRRGALLVMEVDRACRLPEARALIRQTRLPWILRPLWLPIFRTWIAGQSLTAEEARSICAVLDLHRVTVRPLDGSPAFVIAGWK
jgi:ubiquinone/menaquinone biosynthesis C-methylase UbiE